MSELQFLKSITTDQIALILRENEAMPQPDYTQACIRARVSASQIRKPTWSIFSMAHVNALLIGLNRLKYSQSYDVIKLIAVVECFSFGLMGQGGLSFQEFNLAIGPLASVLAPELFAESQTWSQEPVVEVKYVRPYRPESYRFRKPKLKPEEGVDFGALIDSLVKEVGIQAAPQASFHADQASNESVVDALLASIPKSR